MLIRIVRREAKDGHHRLTDGCPLCRVGLEKLFRDVKAVGISEVRALAKKIKVYVCCHPDMVISAQDIYRRFQCADIDMYLALHYLVEDFQLSGPDPYACGAGPTHTEMIYKDLNIPGPKEE